MKIISIRLENFKGEEKREIFADGANVTISGQNGTGKTTIADAYFWIFTGKFADGTSGEVNFFDADGKLVRDKKIHAVEIELDDKNFANKKIPTTFAEGIFFESVNNFV